MKTIKFYFIFPLVFLGVIIFNNSAKADVSYDLKADSLSVNPAMPTAGKATVVTARVKNLGASFKFDFPLKYSLSGFNIDSPTSILPAQGATVNTNDFITLTFYGSFPKIGQASISFSVDPAGYLIESDVNNNSVSATVNVAGYDLAVESLTVYPANPTVNQTCWIQVKVKNLSSYNLFADTGLIAAKNFPDFLTAQASSTMPSLANVINSGGYLYFGYEGKFTSAGEKQLSFNLDKDNFLDESDLTNNVLNQKITVYAAADSDLAINSVSFSKDKVIMGEPIDITVAVKNAGKTSLTSATGLAKAAFNFNLPYFDYGVNDFTLDDYPTMTAALEPGKFFNYKLHGYFNNPGKFNLTFTVNQDKQLTESSYGNNSTTTPLTVYSSLADANSFSIFSKSVSFASSTTAIISWKTDIKTTGILNYNLSSGIISDYKVADSENKTDHAITLNNLKSGAAYRYMITAKSDTIEKPDMINDFTTPANNDVKIISGPSVAAGDKTASVSWTTGLNSTGYVYYRPVGQGNFTAQGSDTAAMEHKVELKDLAYGRYDYFLSSTSTLGTSVKTGLAGFEIKIPDAAAPAAPAASATGQSASASASVSALSANDINLYNRLKGKIILRVQSQGQAYYVSSKDKKIYSLGKPEDAFPVIRSQGIGIANINLMKIPIGLTGLSGADSDGDGLPDAFEEAIGTDKNKADSDGDGFKDKDELASGYSPLVKSAKMNYENKFAAAQKGKIFLQVENRGQAWYVNPADGKRYFLSRPADAFNIMRLLGAGVSSGDFNKLTGK